MRARCPRSPSRVSLPASPSLLVLIHIPKTAGTTLHKILAHQAGPGGVMVRHDSEGPPSGAWLTEVRRRNALGGLVVVGHQSVGLHERLPDVRYVTCLRHPVDRLLSHYHHAKCDPTHYLHRAILEKKLDLAGYVASGLSGELSDGMVRMLAGIEDFDHGVVDDTILERAKTNLMEHFDAVIPNEKFDAGVLLLADGKGWLPPYYIRRKVGRVRPEKPDAATIRVVETHNRHDLELYRWAVARFEEEAASHPGLSGHVSSFQQRNRVWGKLAYLKREAMHRLIKIPRSR